MTQALDLLRPTALLAADDPAPVEIVNPHAAAPVLLTVDHGGKAVPKALRHLGVASGELERHIGWDIGAADVARRTAMKLTATAAIATYTRLLIDANRPLGDPECIPAVSDGTPIPGNQNLSEADVRARAHEVYWPYHHAVGGQIARLRQAGKAPAVVAVHSFTPALTVAAKPRPWHVSVMFSYDDRLGRQLIAAFKHEAGLVVGENEPYSGFIHGYAQKLHGLAQCLPHAQIEIRQDLIATPEGQATWAAILARALQ